jgi:formylglycine-generating enzyme
MTEPHYIFDAPAELKRLSEMVFVEGGTFRMGSEYDDKDASEYEKPAHDVTVDSFYIGKYPVTQALWKAVMNGKNPSDSIGNNLPVQTVSCEDIEVFLERLIQQTGKKCRLPTEAEWEYAAKGGRYFKEFPFKYAGSNKLNEVGWYEENSHRQTKPVGLKSPNFLGIHDMSGNVYEWCSDKIGSFQNYNDVIRQSKKVTETGALFNPKGVLDGFSRVLRGGCYYTKDRCRSTYRYSDADSNRRGYIGFRLVFISPQFR